MAEYADLEVGIHRWERSSYAIDLRFLGPKQDSEDRLLDKGPALVSIDPDALKALPDDPAEYGRTLTRSLFATEALRSAFKVARDRAKDSILRLRIFVGPSAPELHSLKWETLLDPNDPWVKDDPPVDLANGGPLATVPAFLATNERTPFSRFLTAVNFRAIPPRTEDVFRVLAVIANPAEIDRRKVDGIALQPVDVARERGIIESFSKPLGRSTSPRTRGTRSRNWRWSSISSASFSVGSARNSATRPGLMARPCSPVTPNWMTSSRRSGPSAVMDPTASSSPIESSRHSPARSISPQTTIA